MNIYLIIIIAALLVDFFLQNLARYLNNKALVAPLPQEFKDICDEDEYLKSKEYTKTKNRYALFVSTFNLLLILGFILLGGFNYLDLFARHFQFSTVITGIIFFGTLYIIYDLISLPLSLYYTFVIEERFNFNRTTAKTFILDKIKSYIILAILGSAIMGLLFYLFEKFQYHAWFYCWIVVSAFILLAQPLFNLVIAPLFNKFSPLNDGDLKDGIESYSRKVNFPLKEISVMDGSKRSAHSNAYFSGLFKKRIALFDTLIEKHSTSELISIIGHEVGHYKKKHITKGIFISIIHTGVLFYILSFFIKNQSLFEAFKMEHTSIYASFLFFSLLYSPVELILSLLTNYISRKHEYEADEFAAKTTGSAEPMIIALKKLAVSNLSNLTPHPFAVFLNYSHPPVLDRIHRLQVIAPAKQNDRL